MVGPRYRGTLAILSVNGAGAKDDSKALPSSDRMYEACQRLRASEPGASALQAFEALAQAVMASMPDWGVTKHHVQRILDAAPFTRRHRVSLSRPISHVGRCGQQHAS